MSALKFGDRCKNGCFGLQKQFDKFEWENSFIYTHVNELSQDQVKAKIQETLFTDLFRKWQDDLNRDCSRQGIGGNKLRTYRTFKDTSVDELYLHLPLL